MASNTYSLISTITTTGTTTVSFTSIPQTYTDLVLRFMIKNSNSATSSALNITFNSDSTSTNYSSEILRSGTDTGQNGIGQWQGNLGFYQSLSAQGSLWQGFANAELYIPNYTSTAQRPFFNYGTMTDFASTSGQSNFQGGSYLGTSAISSIQMTTPTAGTFNTTLISLYGIKKN